MGPTFFSIGVHFEVMYPAAWWYRHRKYFGYLVSRPIYIQNYTYHNLCAYNAI